MIDGTSPRVSRSRRILRMLIYATRQSYHDWQMHRVHIRQMHSLQQLDDHLLKDIGLARKDVLDAARKVPRPHHRGNT
jgi:uncharacterized protein YjiS (DUF1127 family)